MVQYDIAWPACDSERTARWGEASTEMRSALQMLEKLSSAPTTEQKSMKKVTYKKKIIIIIIPKNSFTVPVPTT